MGNNHTQVSQGFRVLLRVLAPYIARELGNEYGKKWWQVAVLEILYEDQKRDLPGSGDWAQLVDSLDVARCLLLFDLHWHKVFRKKLSIDHRTWAKELVGVRNRLAHLGLEDFTPSDAWRALDTMSRLAEQIDGESAEEIRDLLRTARYGTVNGSTTVTEGSTTPAGQGKKAGILDVGPISGLPNWRDVIEPHPDVAQGRYKNAEFAADLAQVARGEGAYEYRDPVEFFARTYVTEGMTGLLEQSLRRICGKDGEPVIQLKTAFGGGKTHSMLALYHMMRGRITVDKIPNVKPVLERAGVAVLPKANVAVLVGTALDPTRSKRPGNMPGITINTIWGEMAAQLAQAAGKPEIYNYVKEADKKGVSPGSEGLKNLFDAAGPCLILMDEVVAYAKKIYGARGLPAGTFDNFISFIQEITEAARASKNSLVVASIPESDIEIGGEAGKTALETIEHTFGRMESIWKPVAANEGFEVVRRRLFLDCKDPEGRDKVCARFSRMYNENQSDFPLETKELEYKERMVSCYPIHPEVFDRLYEDWATLERFQRTRGVLRLMAAVIHELWMGNDAGLMIMPGSIPLDVPNVRDELTRHLSEGWNALVDREVDGKHSIPYQRDQANPRYGSKLAARRVARTVMLGSAPTVRDQNVRGIEASRIRLGVVQPGENIANFNDALSTLALSLAYLYTNPSGDRYWYDTRPTLRKTVEDRATQISAPDVEYEIETRLRKLRKEKPFAGIHICPASSLDVPDDQAARLVILGPADVYKASNKNNSAMTAVKDILDNRGNTPRTYRNMLAFVVPDQDLMFSLKQAARLYLAWKSIQEDSVDLNLDAAQNRETELSLGRSNETVEARIKETYCWLLIPYIDKEIDIKTIVWDIIRINGGAEGIIAKAAKKMIQNEAVITTWAPALLLMELENLLWRESDNIHIKTLWEYLCTYCYLPRLASEKVLEETIRTGLDSTEYFAFASAFDGTRYVDLKFDKYVSVVERSGYLVKVDVARKQLAADEAKRQAEKAAQTGKGITDSTNGKDGSTVYPDPLGTGGEEEGIREDDEDSPPAVEIPKNTRFYMTAQLDITRIGRDVQQLVEEVINHLTSVDRAQVEVSLELNVKSPDGLSIDTVRTVSENCRELKVKDFGFEE
ncbi:MAG: ATP-binding protein [Peptococcaceae bacterium]|nr:ATP-binding protein [Candidatus Syntrophopropionicum ammoniitolerans]